MFYKVYETNVLMKILVVGDLHGNKPKIYFKDFDAIISIGDVCSDKGFRPLVKKWFKYREMKGNSLNLDKFIVREIGKKQVKQLEKESLDAGKNILKFLCSFGKPVFFIPGNWDQSYGKSKIKNLDKSDYNYRMAFLDYFLGSKTNSKLISGLKGILDCQYKIVNCRGFNFIGYGAASNDEALYRKSSNISKHKVKLLDKRYFQILNKLNSIYKKRNKSDPTIFFSHNVPYGTKLDILVNKKSIHHGKNFGSRISLDFIKKHHPILCIGGHMHEHFGKQKIGRTVCINAGFGSKVNTLIDLDEEKGKIRSIKFHKGKKH